MYVVSRRVDESVLLRFPINKDGDECEYLEARILLADLKSNQAKLAIDAPRDIEIIREYPSVEAQLKRMMKHKQKELDDQEVVAALEAIEQALDAEDVELANKFIGELVKRGVEIEVKDDTIHWSRSGNR